MIKFIPLESFSSVADNYLTPVESLMIVDQVNEYCNKTIYLIIDKNLEDLRGITKMILINCFIFYRK